MEKSRNINIRLGIIAFAALSLLGTSSCSKKSTPIQNDNRTTNLVGNDKDKHGCIGSAGYVWSEVMQDCIRPFESEIKLFSNSDKYSSFAAYIIPSEDNKKIEIFLIEAPDGSIILDLQDDNTYKGKDSEGSIYVVKHKGNDWKLYLNKVLEYKTEK